MSKNKFSKEKISIYNDINQFKNRYNELNNRINALEKYKLDQEKKHFWEMKAFGQRKKGNNMNISLGFDYMDFNNMENFQQLKFFHLSYIFLLRYFPLLLNKLYNYLFEYLHY